MAKKVLNLLMDVDHCLFHSYSRSRDISNWLIETNQKLLATIIKNITREGYDKVIISLGSNRQDQKVDQINPGGSCSAVLPLLQSYLAQRLGDFCEVVLDPFLLADLYHSSNPKAGSSYEAILMDQFRGAAHLAHGRSVLDRSKIALVYAFAHRVGVLHSEAEKIVIEFYDDNNNILNSIHHFFKKTPMALPSNTTLQVIQYYGDCCPFWTFKPIQGIGIIDTLYEWSVRFLYSQTYFYEHGAGEGRSIKTAEALQIAHQENHYNRPGRLHEMSVATNTYKALQRFYEKEKEKLLPNPALVMTDAYTTALELYQRHLIPGHYVLNYRLPSAILPDIPPIRLSELKTRIEAIFAAYISCWKCSFFGHHHNARAMIVLEALLQAKTLMDIEEILNNQQRLFISPELTTTTGALEPRWSEEALVVNKRRPGTIVGYAQAVLNALVVVREFGYVQDVIPIPSSFSLD